MKKRIWALCLAGCLLLTGCEGIFDSSYVYTEPHKEENTQTDTGAIQASDYDSLCKALANLAENGTESGIVYVPRYDQSKISADISKAGRQTLLDNPIAAYAVEDIQCELGTSGGQSAIAVNITYVHDRSEIRKIRRVTDLEMAKAVITEELDNCAAGVVLYLENFEAVDLAQMVEDYADSSPQTVMETPQVTVNIYPETGDSRVVELKFTYQNSRDSLRSMQEQVSPVFASAVLYVSGDAAEREKFSQLYSFLMERYEYKVETSITPAYSLLRHGVGDSKAFAVVYGAMCRRAGLNCYVVTGTRWGEPWFWNIVEDDGQYYHVDLLRCSEEGYFQERTDAEMEDYVWDYSAYTEKTEETVPSES